MRKAIISYVVVFASLVVMFGIHPSIFAAEEEASSSAPMAPSRGPLWGQTKAWLPGFGFFTLMVH